MGEKQNNPIEGPIGKEPQASGEIATLEARNRELEARSLELEAQTAVLKSKIAELETLAYRDDLTGAFNLRGFKREAENAIASKQQMKLELANHSEVRRTPKNGCVLFMDVDGLKETNDLFGHSAGDQAVKNAIDEIRKRVRGTDIVARIGGDEVAIFFPDSTAEAILSNFYDPQRGLASFSFDIQTEDTGLFKQITLTMSGGIADVEDGLSLEEAIARADKALYESKRAGRGRITQFAPEKSQKSAH